MMVVVGLMIGVGAAVMRTRRVEDGVGDFIQEEMGVDMSAVVSVGGREPNLSCPRLVRVRLWYAAQKLES